MILFAAVFTIGMTLGAKKFDRCLLPVFPMLDIIAILGWISTAVVLASQLRNRLAKISSWKSSVSAFYSVILFCVVGLHGLLGFLQFPYYLTYLL